MKHLTAEERETLAIKILNKWHHRMNEVAMLSLDQSYIAKLDIHSKMTRAMADELVDIVSEELSK